MSAVNLLIIVIVSLAVLAILLFLIVQNRKDKKAFTPEDTEDVMEETRNKISGEGDKL